jgi:ubiquinone/menaquinone biosynthesis C-methylase UbiE
LENHTIKGISSMTRKIIYSDEPKDKSQFTEQFDNFYSQIAHIYNWFVNIIPLWRKWLRHALPWIQGARVLEVSFGTGYLLTQYAPQFNSYGVDYNQKMTMIAKNNLTRCNQIASLKIANVEALPYADESFDTILNTMSFSGYPDGERALSEMSRVLKSGGRMIIVDINYPVDGNRIGTFLTRCWKAGGDIIRDMEALFDTFGFDCMDEEIGGFGSVHLYVGVKPSQ